MTTFGARWVTVTQGRQCGFRGRRGRVPPLELPLDNSPQPFSPPADLTSRNFLQFYSTIERPSIAVILPRYPGTRITRLIQKRSFGGSVSLAAYSFDDSDRTVLSVVTPS
ncbi:hypothetical protein QLX08_010037 [Tetragonisca angustula]|uniref:Uncharacterized protein n=1 Tax=Tetragonisca angustula TaxID=166442 RepID=A0AAW0ZE24_9HYME